MKHICFLDLVVFDRDQISYEMGTSSKEYALSTNLGTLTEVTYSDGILHFLFAEGEIRLEIVLEDMFNFLKSNFNFMKKSEQNGN